MFVVDESVEVDVTTFQTNLRAPFSALIQVLGPPSKDVPEKCSTIWYLRGEANPEQVIMLKDWQDEDDSSFKLSAFRALPTYDWEVWASDKAAGVVFCRWLSAQVIAKLGEVKTVSAEGKAELNKLLAQGVPLAEAMKRVPTQKPADLAERFAWPIKDA
jgi:hypothetical protein